MAESAAEPERGKKGETECPAGCTQDGQGNRLASRGERLALKMSSGGKYTPAVQVFS